jgi:hypothetical protein
MGQMGGPYCLDIYNLSKQKSMAGGQEKDEHESFTQLHAARGGISFPARKKAGVIRAGAKNMGRVFLD